jgi:pyruvate dehydrogenase E1 component beta subunit
VYRRRGRDLTIAGASHTLELALQAADKLASEGIEAEVIDLRTVKPLDEAILEESVQKTGRLLAVDTAWAIGGVCAELGCLAAEKWFRHLRAPVRRIGLPDIPTPAGYALEQFYYPDVERITRVIREMCGK